MTRTEHETFAEQVITYFKTHGRRATIHHFEEQGKSRRTVYHILKRYEDKGQERFKPIPGRPLGDGFSKVKSLFLERPLTRIRDAAKELNMPKSTVSHIRIKMLGMKPCKKRTLKQNKDQEASGSLT